LYVTIINHDDDPLQERFKQFAKARELLASVFVPW